MMPFVDANADVTNNDLLALLAGELTTREIRWRREREEERKQYQKSKIEVKKYLSQFCTRVLLKKYRFLRESNWHNREIYNREKFPDDKMNYHHGMRAVLEAYKEVLDTREHVSKGKEARQLRAKQKTGLRKGKNR